MLMQCAQTYREIVDCEGLEDFTILCKIFGSREDLIQGGGGNISVKRDDGSMIIKASGTDIFSSQYVLVNTKKIANFLSTKNECDDESKFLSECLVSGSSLPSLETFFHSVTKKYTVHLHPLNVVNGLSYVSIKDDVKKEFNCSVIEYKRPGFELSKEVYKNLNDIVFLENHGLIVHSDDFNELLENVEKILEYFNNHCYPNISFIDLHSTYIQHELALKYKNIFYVAPVRFNISLPIDKSPDCVVYCGIISNLDNLPDSCPNLIEYKGNIYAVGNSYVKCKQAIDVAYLYSTFCSNAPNLNEEEKDRILNWSSEKYRKQC